LIACKGSSIFKIIFSSLVGYRLWEENTGIKLKDEKNNFPNFFFLNVGLKM